MDFVLPLMALSAMEIVLGIDNIVFIAIITARLPEAQRPAARKLGLVLALGMRILLLLSISWVMSASEPVIYLESFLPESISTWLKGDSAAEEETYKAINGISVRDLILLLGGLFLLAKATWEIHHQMESKADDANGPPAKKTSFKTVLIQIMLLDLVFSLDSVITAVGMVQQVWVMIAAVIISIGVMVVFANPVSEFVQRHPTIKMLALSFLMLIGVMLMGEGLGLHIPKGYIYFAMAFSLLVEFLNMKAGMRLGPRKPAAEAGSHSSISVS
jgi:predicted tellurium resistance membrane protein TerC